MALLHSTCKSCARIIFLTLLLTLNYIFSQENIEISYSIPEQVPYNTFLGNVIDDSNLRSLYSAREIDSFQFGLLSGGRYNNYYQISNDGNLATEDPLNREDVCPSSEICVLSIDAAILQPALYFTVINIKITIQDRNDYTPTFPQPRLVINMSESTVPGAEFVLPPATDLDSPQFGILYYEITPPLEEFDLRVNTNSDGSKDLRLKLRKRLDRETNARYAMSLSVYDGGEPPKQGSMEVEVNLVDHNDNSPVFAQNMYNLTIDENFPLDTSFIQVQATDKDDGLNGLVQYMLSAQTRAAYGDLFHIDSATGAITLGSSLNYEDHRLYTIQIEASDHGVGSLPAIAKVYLYVQDVNDHPPELTISGLSLNGNIEIPEESNADIPVAHISVSDSDTGVNGEVECASPDSNNFVLREKQGSTFMLLSARTFDYETRTSYTVPVICRDHGTPQLSTSVDISIAIVDVNDNAPIFDTNTYALRFRENNTINDPVLRVTATDRDSGDNGAITYSINDAAKDKVRIDPVTGDITALIEFDYEEMHTFIFHVIAQDNGTPEAKSDNATVVLTLIDTNDEAPSFLQDSYTFGTFENQIIGTEIGTIQAEDRDSPPYDEFKFSLDNRSNAMNVFVINADTAEISTLRMLDREHVNEYHMTVYATNQAFPQLSSSVSVTIYVVDRNDNAPFVTFPSSDNNSVSVMANAARGSIFTRIIARDADLGKNARLQYSIARGNEEGLFSVDAITGAMTVENELSLADLSEYELLIMVKDEGDDERKSAVSTLNIYINKTVIISDGQNKGKGDGGGSIQDSHKLVIIILAAVTVVLCIILITAIIIIKLRQNEHSRQHAQAQYKVEVAHHVGEDLNQLDGGGQPLQSDNTPDMTSQYDKNHDENGTNDRSHLTLEDIKRMKCLYRNTPDVARHEQYAPPDDRQFHQSGQAYNVRKQAEMQGIFDLLNDGENPLDDDSLDSNADSGRGTSDAGNDLSALKINTSDDRPVVVNKNGILTPVHLYLKDKPSVVSQRQRGDPNQSSFGPHLQRLAPRTGDVTRHRPQQHVTFDLSNQTAYSKQFHPKDNQAILNSRVPINASLNNHARTVSPYMDMSKNSRAHARNLPVHSSHSEVSESADNVSLASTTSGSYILQLDQGPLSSVEV